MPGGEQALSKRWVGAEVELRLSKPPPMSGLSEAVVKAALDDAAHVWNQVLEACGAPRIRIWSEVSSESAVARDGVSRVVVRQSWCPAGARDFEDCYDARRAAITHAYSQGSPVDGVALVTEADIEINAQHFRWSTAGGPGERPLTATLTHELGHVLGLDHPCREPHEVGPGDVSCADPAVKGLLMYPDPAEEGRDRVSKPHPSEVDAACARYVAASATSEATGLGLGVGAALAVALLGLVLFRWRKGTGPSPSVT